MFDDVEQRIKKQNKILFSRQSECLQGLKNLIEQQTRRTLVLWSLDCAKIPLARIEEKIPGESRPKVALEVCEAWSRGEIKMPIAKRAILDAHAVAKGIDDAECGALCHAIGHACGTIHTETHALGLPFYELTALVLRYGKDGYRKPVCEKIGYYCDRLVCWQENTDKQDRGWAKFLLDDTRPNQQRLRNEKHASGKSGI